MHRERMLRVRLMLVTFDEALGQLLELRDRLGVALAAYTGDGLLQGADGLRLFAASLTRMEMLVEDASCVAVRHLTVNDLLNPLERLAADRVVAALSVSGPVFRMDMARAQSLVPDLKAICAEISKGVRA